MNACLLGEKLTTYLEVVENSKLFTYSWFVLNFADIENDMINIYAQISI